MIQDFQQSEKFAKIKGEHQNEGKDRPGTQQGRNGVSRDSTYSLTHDSNSRDHDGRICGPEQ
jgi:hypothetical protein